MTKPLLTNKFALKMMLMAVLVIGGFFMAQSSKAYYYEAYYDLPEGNTGGIWDEMHAWYPFLSYRNVESVGANFTITPGGPNTPEIWIILRVSSEDGSCILEQGRIWTQADGVLGGGFPMTIDVDPGTCPGAPYLAADFGIYVNADPATYYDAVRVSYNFYGVLGCDTGAPSGCVTSSDAPPTCPLAAEAGRTRVNFGVGAGGYRGTGIVDSSMTGGPVSLSLPAGTYQVNLSTFDFHTEHGEQGQMNEQWFMRLFNGGGDNIGETSVSQDIGPDEDYVQGITDNNFVLAEDATSGISVGVGESALPLCAAFDDVAAPPASVAPAVSITLYEVNGETPASGILLKNGDILTFRVVMRNIGTIPTTNISAINSLVRAEYDPSGIPNSFSCISAVCVVDSSSPSSVSFHTNTPINPGSQFTVDMKSRLTVGTGVIQELVTFRTQGSYNPGSLPFDETQNLVAPAKLGTPIFRETAP